MLITELYSLVGAVLCLARKQSLYINIICMYCSSGLYIPTSGDDEKVADTGDEGRKSSS